ncbi:MAG TPA: glycosyltransferase [Terriglobia bacterium]|nr:glycosyltransferase [Terriglobia bacterium]
MSRRSAWDFGRALGAGSEFSIDEGDCVRALIAVDHHFVRPARGAVYLGPPMAIAGYGFWGQYLKVFDEIVVLARVRQTGDGPPMTAQADGPGVTFCDLPDFWGPWEYFRFLASLKRRVREAVAETDTSILRVPGTIGQLAWKMIRGTGRPYALDVVADPWDMFSPGAAPSIVRPVVRLNWANRLMQMCREAPAISYVTRDALQRRYPPGPKSWTACFSDVDLGHGLAEPDQLQTRMARLAEDSSSNSNHGTRRFRLGFVGALAQMYKAPDVLLYAVADCLRQGLDLEVAIAGDGKFRPAMEDLAHRLGIADRVRFLGVLSPGEAVRRFLDGVDLFVLPSRQEGLPRAMVEAMARGCPCIGAAVGGIPELLPREDLVAPGDVAALTAKIGEVLANSDRMTRMARQNWKTAQEYRLDILEERRAAFYRGVREQAEEARKQTPSSEGK